MSVLTYRLSMGTRGMSDTEAEAEIVRIARSVPGDGMTELLLIVDVERDGREEVLYGGTTASAGLTGVAVFVDGALREVRLPRGEPLTLMEGLVEFEGDRPARAGAWG